jgi:hypothetical protein
MSTHIEGNRIIPRSILRHRPIATQDAPDILPWIHTSQRSRLSQNTEHVHTRTKRTAGTSTHMFIKPHSSLSFATLVGSGMGIVLMLILLAQTVFGWANLALDDWRYGYPRTYQINAYVGHEQSNQPSHFIAINNKGRVEIIELPGNDASRARIFLGPQLSGSNADLIPVTLQFVVDPHHIHTPNMLVHIQQSSILFHNINGTFQLQL